MNRQQRKERLKYLNTFRKQKYYNQRIKDIKRRQMLSLLLPLTEIGGPKGCRYCVYGCKTPKRPRTIRTYYYCCYCHYLVFGGSCRMHKIGG